MDVNEQENMLK